MSEPRIPPAVKAFVAERAGFCCEYCLSQLHYSPDPFAVDHVIPRMLGGSDDPANLALACSGCNGRKFTHVTAIDPVSGEVSPLFHPRQDRWSDHFMWSTDQTEILGLTRTGRATVQKLALNRPGVVNLRRTLVAVGRHPPG